MHPTSRIHECFEAFAASQPSAPAIITDDRVLTYAELNEAADALAMELFERGIGAGQAIGVLVERSVRLPEAFLAIQKAGGVYVPMVADLPGDRLANMARQADVRLMIALDGIDPPEALAASLTGNGATPVSDVIIRPESLFPCRQTGLKKRSDLPEEAAALAAILFTSGSTGTPKGVMIRHDSCLNMALGHVKAHAIDAGDRILLSASPGFILGFRELCLPLGSGAAFVPVSRALINDPDSLLALMDRHLVSLSMFTPSYLRLLRGRLPHGLRCVITAGERPNPDDARRYARHCEYWNVHGATEVCGTICMHRVDPNGAGPLPSGRPFTNTSVHLLDEHGVEVPPGEIGEIHVVGVGVSPGYLQQPELTAASFVETAFGRAYRTRDLGRWNGEGNLETLGRADDSVKVSGQMVSLGEIESALIRHPHVSRAAAFQLRGKLVACVECPDPDQGSGVDWREFLARTLPSYMIPSRVATLSGMPISSAGKVDRKTLLEMAAPLFSGLTERERGSVPRGDLELSIARIWEDLLDFRPIMRQDNFFAVGGTSLLAIAVSQRLRDLGHHVPVQTVLSALTVESLAGRIAAEKGRCSMADDHQLVENFATLDQEDFRIAAEIGLAPGASHITRILAVNGHIPRSDIWRMAWDRLIERHAALRTMFYPDENGRLRWRTLDSRELAHGRRFSFDRCATIEEARELVAGRANERFGFNEPPLARAGLITVSQGDETLFWFVFHHAVVDGMSAGLIQEELLALLANRVLPPVPHGIALASHGQQRYLASDQVSRDREFWHARLASLVEREGEAFNEYVAERPRPAFASGRGAPLLTERLDAETVAALGRLARTHGAGLHALLLALLAFEVRRRCGNRDIIIASGISLRPAGGESAVGHFVNLLPVILEGRPELPFSTLLRETQRSLTETVGHASYPAALLNREFRQRYPEQRPSSRTALFDIALTAIPPRIYRDRESGISLAPRQIPGELEYAPSGLDLSFSHEPCPGDGGGLKLLLVRNPDVCSAEGARAWLSSLASWAAWLAEAPERAERPLPPLLPREKELLKRWEPGPDLPVPTLRCHEIFQKLADRGPDRLAVVCPDRAETRARLDARANGIARRLIGLGLEPGNAVALLAAVTPDLPATVLGIWKAGGVYLPLPSGFPPARLLAMAADSDAKFLMVLDGIDAPPALTDALGPVIRPGECPPSEQRPAVGGRPDDPAYIIYTSGTTGAPKGVPVTHASYVNAVLGVAERIGFRPDDRMSLVSAVGFDASLWELGHGFMNGIALVPVVQELRDDPWEMKRYYRNLGVTVAFHPPSYLRVSEKVPFDGLRILLTGGEPPNQRDARHHAGQLEFWNFYGPTEATIVIAGERIRADHAENTPLPVGRPLANTRITLRHADGAPVPPGSRGELWLGGPGISAGYLNLPELSAVSFVTLADERFYRSGDFGRWTEDGRLVLCGRMDDQVKLNGQRVELGEIEHTLRLHPAVVDAVALLDRTTDGVDVLRAFVRLEDETLTETHLKAFLSKRLSAHMTPATITPVAVIPLTPTGKVDRGLLLESARLESAAVAKEAPQGPFETAVAAIWAELLKVPVGREDNFFALGGNSLLAVQVAHRVSGRMDLRAPARLLFAAPTLAVFAAEIAKLPTGGGAAETVSGTDIATEGEREFRTAESAGLDTRVFTIPVHYLVIGEVSVDRWQAAWSTLVSRHQGLRTFFREDGSGLLRRRIAHSLEGKLEFSTADDPAAALLRIRRRQAEPLFMEIPPLWRAGVVETGNGGKSFFWLALHHAIGDGQSVGTLLAELTSLLAGESLPPSAGSPGLFAAREFSYLASTESRADADYWINMLRGVPDSAFAEWPLDMARSAKSPPGNHRFETLLGPGTAAGLKALCRNHQASLHSLMLALMATEAGRRAGRAEVMIGTTASIREAESDEMVVGYGVNMLPLLLMPSAARPFGNLLAATQRSLAQALQHSRQPFARIYRAFWNERPGTRHPQRYPLFDMAVTENPNTGPGRLSRRFKRAGAATGSIGYERTDVSPGQDMVLIHEELGEEGLLLQFHVNAAVYTPVTGRAWFEALAGWARWLGEDPDRAGCQLPHLLPEEEKRLAGWERGDTVERPPLRFHELFEAVVDRPEQGDRPAVITLNGAISYRELDEKANLIANALLRQNTGHSAVVGVLTNRSPGLPAAILGVWKAGAIYLPLAADLPPERLAYMARDAGVSRLIVLDGLDVPEQLAATLPLPLRPEELSRHIHEKRPAVDGRPDDPAYILYTSGSTGKPKGTLIGHDSYVNLALGAAEMLGLTRDDRCLMFASPSFDVSLSDIGVPLATGAAACPAPMEVVESPSRFLHFLRRLQITLADITPTYLRLFEGAELPPSLRILVTGGEAPSSGEIKLYGSRISYFNAYGPTENTITSSMGLLRDDGRAGISAGRPLPNTSFRIVGMDGRPLPPAVMGEILLGGVGLARCYLNRPDLTKARFIETADGRWYRTGDLGRWRADGTIEIAGRIDDQVKLNGIRIELGEIEQTLAGHPAISQAVALLIGHRDRGKSLWAVVRMAREAEMPAEKDWRSFLGERLPSHMIPSGILPVAHIPLTASGKIDRSALRALFAERLEPSGLTLPQDELEQAVAGVWREALGLERVHREDNFFALGGHSLLAISVAHRLERLLGRETPARELFAEPTLAGFAAKLRLARPSGQSADASSDLATVGQTEFWTAQQAGLDTSGFNISLTFAWRGEPPPAERWSAAWSEILSRHDALRTGFHEDETGVLRRRVEEQPDAGLEIGEAPGYQEALARIAARQSEPFSMAVPGLWRAGVIRTADGGPPLFWLVLNHAVADGISLGILAGEMAKLLRGDHLAPPPASFNKAAANEVAYLAGETAHVDAAYWRSVISGLIEETPDAFDDWPLDNPRPAGGMAAAVRGSHRFRARLGRNVADGLRRLARESNSTLHALMLTLLGCEARRRAGRLSFLIGTAASTRQSAAEACTVGYFVNMIPLLFSAGPDEPFDTAVRSMQQRLAEALQHSRYPFARIYGDFRSERTRAAHPGRYPLFDIAVTENPAGDPGTDTAFAGVNVPEPGGVSYEWRFGGPPQDLVLVHEGDTDGSLVLSWFANAAIYTRDSARAWFDALLGWMRFLADDPSRNISALPRLLPGEERLLAAWQRGPVCPLPAPSFPCLFARLAATRPESPALVTDAGILSFAAIDARADVLARALLNHGLKRGEPVAVLTERSAALPETALAIWKAGGCYLPLVADLPAERLAFMAADAGARILIVLDRLTPPARLGPECLTVLRPENLPATGDADNRPATLPAIAAEEPAYIIYTSGSTGAPKGVVLRHGGLLNLGLGAAESLGVGADDCVLLISSPSFDLWISDLAMAWSAGAALAPVRREEMDDIPGMSALLRRLGVTIATMPPSYLRLFERAEFPTLRALMTVGEPPIADDARHYSARFPYFNGYGPAENTAATTIGRLQPDAELIAAGRPIPNVEVMIVDRDGRPTPPGVTGEIMIGGIGLAAGYLNRPDLTAASFVESTGARRYRSGDLGRWLPSGELQIIGRADGQVKLRGQRVELGEIEHCLAARPGVRQAVAAVETTAGQNPTLMAFVVLDPALPEPTQADWSAFLAKSLPSYMVPSLVLRVETIPVTTAGKTDRRALLSLVAAPYLLRQRHRADGETSRPQNETEKVVAAVWAEMLECQHVGREDNFFELGGDSLRAIAVINRLQRQFRCRVNDLYEHPLLADFASLCRPRPDHLRVMLDSVRDAWEEDRHLRGKAETGDDDSLRQQRVAYETRLCSDLSRDLSCRRPYRRVLLTGATGYLGSYLLAVLLSDAGAEVTVLVRGDNSRSARHRLRRTLVHYFGEATGASMADNRRLRVLAGDLRHGDLRLSPADYGELAATINAVYHCAANVNHVGHYRDFLVDNVDATRHLLTLAGRRKQSPADFHHISTLSVAGTAQTGCFRLFTEYDLAPDKPDDNYYVRSKQKAEHLVIASRNELANASIHRVGNIAFAAGGCRLQRNITENAFFRLVTAFVALGAVPTELRVSLSHVDLVARAIKALAETGALANETHHIETKRNDLMADFIRSADGMEERVRQCDFGAFLERLQAAVDEPGMASPLAEAVAALGLRTGHPPLARQERLEIASDRTQLLMERLGIVWPAIPPAGQNAMMGAVLDALKR